MTFSRGLYPGWMHGVNHQELVHARFGKKRGPFVGRVTRVTSDHVAFDAEVPLKPGDGIVFDTGEDTDQEQGGRIYGIRGDRYSFRHGHLDHSKIPVGARVWKTNDPELEKRLRQSYGGRIAPRRRISFDIAVSGGVGEPLVITSSGITVTSLMPLEAARTSPLTEGKLRSQLGKSGETELELRNITLDLKGEVILPIGEINRMRRVLLARLIVASERKRPEFPDGWRSVFSDSFAESNGAPKNGAPPALNVLCRSLEQLGAALDFGIKELSVDFEDIRRYKEAVALVRRRGGDARILLATPRIQKAAEEGFFKLLENAEPDGVLIRNLGAIPYFAGKSLTAVGDFSLNVSNPLTAQFLINAGLERVTVSYDLNATQVLDLLSEAPADWFELTIHQHMPMFHMEHCVFAAFLSRGKDHTDCGRPCEVHRVHLRDRVGMSHPLRADVGCRNTLFNAVPQTGAGYYDEFRAAGLGYFRVELLEEDVGETIRILQAYTALLRGETDGAGLWRMLRARAQLGVTSGTLSER